MAYERGAIWLCLGAKRRGAMAYEHRAASGSNLAERHDIQHVPSPSDSSPQDGAMPRATAAHPARPMPWKLARPNVETLGRSHA